MNDIISFFKNRTNLIQTIIICLVLLFSMQTCRNNKQRILQLKKTNEALIKNNEAWEELIFTKEQELNDLFREYAEKCLLIEKEMDNQNLTIEEIKARLEK